MNYLLTTGAYKSKRKKELKEFVVWLIFGIILGMLIMAFLPITAHAAQDPNDLTWNPYASIEITAKEFDELRWVVALEAQGEGYEGECYVVEAILNRVLSEKNNWGNNVHEVLSKKGQFSTYKYINHKKAWAIPGEIEDDAISDVIRRGPSRLPSMSYVYFDSLGGKNGKDKIKVGGHWFGRE